MNIHYENIMLIEKSKLSSLQSNFHKLLNTINLYKGPVKNNEIVLKIMELNELIDKLDSDIIHLKEDILLEEMETKYISKYNKKKIKEIENDNKAIQTFLPLIFMYRTLLNP